MSTMSKHLLLVSPGKPDDGALLEALGHAGYVTTGWSSDRYATAALGIEQADLVVVDVGPSGARSFAELERLRCAVRAIPVLVVLPDSNAKDRIEALDAGADDCLSRPFDPEELRARLDALSRRRREQRLQLGAFVWHWNHRQASIGSAPLQLSPCETSLLEALLKSPDRIVATSTLARRIEGGNRDATRNRLYVYICRLRKKLAGARIAIRSSSGLGYSLDTRGILLEAEAR